MNHPLDREYSDLAEEIAKEIDETLGAFGRGSWPLHAGAKLGVQWLLDRQKREAKK